MYENNFDGSDQAIRTIITSKQVSHSSTTHG